MRIGVTKLGYLGLMIENRRGGRGAPRLQLVLELSKVCRRSAGADKECYLTIENVSQPSHANGCCNR